MNSARADDAPAGIRPETAICNPNSSLLKWFTTLYRSSAPVMFAPAMAPVVSAVSQ